MNQAGVTVAVVGWSGIHGGYHLDHFIKTVAGVATVINIDPQATPSDTWAVVDGVRVIHVRKTLEQWLASDAAQANPDLILDSTDDDDEHSKNIERIMDAGISGLKVICSEKPVATSVEDLGLLVKLQARAIEAGVEITTCLPRLLDEPYMKLIAMMTDLEQEFGELRHVDHSFGFHKDDLTASAGLDHMAHEVSLVMELLSAIGKADEKASYGEPIDSPQWYHLAGKVGNIGLSIGGNKKLKDNKEEVRLTFFKEGVETIVVLDAIKGTLIARQWEEVKKQEEVGARNPAARLTRVSQHLVDMTQGSPDYIGKEAKSAAVELPAKFFPQS